jgi:cell division septum initiation protein DivIVA
MTVEFIAQSMAEAIRAISDLRAELEIAYEHLHAAEAERDRLKAAADEWQMQAEQAEAVQDALRADAERSGTMLQWILSAWAAEDAARAAGATAWDARAAWAAAWDAAREKP